MGAFFYALCYYISMKTKLALCLALIVALSLPTTIYANDTVNACDPTAECEDTETKTTEGFVEISMDEALSYFNEKKSVIGIANKSQSILVIGKALKQFSQICICTRISLKILCQK